MFRGGDIRQRPSVWFIYILNFVLMEKFWSFCSYFLSYLLCRGFPKDRGESNNEYFRIVLFPYSTKRALHHKLFPLNFTKFFQKFYLLTPVTDSEHLWTFLSEKLIVNLSNTTGFHLDRISLGIGVMIFNCACSFEGMSFKTICLLRI